MSDLKFIVTELNRQLKTEYNLISFDSLPIVNLVQLLVDLLHTFDALTKVTIRQRKHLLSIRVNASFILLLSISLFSVRCRKYRPRHHEEPYFGRAQPFAIPSCRTELCLAGQEDINRR